MKNVIKCYKPASSKVSDVYYSVMGASAAMLYTSSAQAALVGADEAGIVESLGSGTNAITQGQGAITMVLQTLAVLVGASVTIGLGMLIHPQAGVLSALGMGPSGKGDTNSS